MLKYGNLYSTLLFAAVFDAEYRPVLLPMVKNQLSKTNIPVIANSFKTVFVVDVYI